MRMFATRSLVGIVILVSIVVTVVTELRIAGHGSMLLSAIVAYAASFINIACSGLGFRTPERSWWIGNIGLSVLAFMLIGTPTIPSALWTAGRVLFARLAA